MNTSTCVPKINTGIPMFKIINIYLSYKWLLSSVCLENNQIVF